MPPADRELAQQRPKMRQGIIGRLSGRKSDLGQGIGLPNWREMDFLMLCKSVGEILCGLHEMRAKGKKKSILR
jgi:hypothetical protein